jgi:hypothetical protein
MIIPNEFIKSIAYKILNSEPYNLYPRYSNWGKNIQLLNYWIFITKNMELINILKIKIRYLLKYDKIINKKLNIPH